MTSSNLKTLISSLPEHLQSELKKSIQILDDENTLRHDFIFNEKNYLDEEVNEEDIREERDALVEYSNAIFRTEMENMVHVFVSIWERVQNERKEGIVNNRKSQAWAYNDWGSLESMDSSFDSNDQSITPPRVKSTGRRLYCTKEDWRFPRRPTENISLVAWLKDSETKQCMLCHAYFTFVNRRHHCRNCGGIFCGECSKKKVILPGGGDDSQRVCDKCFAMCI